MRTFGQSRPPAGLTFCFRRDLIRRIGGFLRASVLWAGLAIAASPALSEEFIADVEAFNAGTYGRLIFTFRDQTLLPEFTSRIANGILQIDFANPVQAPVSHVPAAMLDYISVALEDPAGFGVRFGLKSAFRINTMEAGEKLFVDILPRNWKGAPPPLPDDVIRALAERAEAALKRVRDLEGKRFGKVKKPKISLRVGRHPTFSRLSFFWNVPFDASFQREGDLVRLVFSRDSDLNLYDLLADMPPGIIDFDTFEEDGKLKVILQVDDDVDVRAFREEDAYVVDIAPRNRKPTDAVNTQVREALAESNAGARSEIVSAPGIPSEQAAAPAPMPASMRAANASPPPAASQNVMTPSQPAPAAVEAETPNSVAAAVAGMPEPVTGKPESDPVSQAGEPAVHISEAAPTSPAAARPIPRIAMIDTDIAPINPETDPLLHGVSRPVAIGPGGRTMDPSDIPVRGGQSIEGSDDAFAPVATSLVDAEAGKVGKLTRIVFPFKERTAAAVFTRHSSLWLIFETTHPIGLDNLRSALKSVASTITAGKLGTAQTIRIDLTEQVLTTVGVDGDSWIVNIGDLILEPSKPVSFSRSVRADGGMTLAADFAEMGAIRRMKDPKVGDDIFVVTAFGPARGVIKPQRFVEIDVLSSAHGIALISRSDELSVVYKDDRVIVEQPRGLALSSQNLAAGITLLPVSAGVSRPGFVDFKEMREPDPLRFRRRKAHLQSDINKAAEGAKTAEWLALARFYLANRFAHEALGILTLVGELDPAITNDSAYLLMMSAAETLAGRPKDAARYILQNELENSPDADIWKVIHYSGIRKWAEARKSLKRARKAVGNYPPDLQALFNISAAEAAVELNDYGEAIAVLAEIDPAVIEPVYAARYDILRARLADVSDRTDDAVKLLQRVIEFGQRPSVAEANYQLLKIQHRDNLLPTDKIIEALQRLAVVWRGDELELKSVRFLAQLLAERGQYRDAFIAARAALFVDGEAETTKLVQEEMNAVFTTLFIDGKADDMEPVEGLGLFYDFREMTPIGPRGDAIVRNLAARLVDVDLLDQAAELLQHQVDNRLKGAARAQISADLALIYLLDRKPDKALRALRRSRQAKLPESMERQRRLVESRALVESGRFQTALDLLATLRGPEAERMTADALWAGKKWEDAGKQFEGLVAGRWSLQAPLSERDRLDVLKSAIGFALAGNQLALDRLRTKFSDKMAETEHAVAFDAVTRTIDVSGTEFASVASQVAAIDTLELFLKDYRERYSQEPGDAPSEPAPPAANQAATAQSEPAA